MSWEQLVSVRDQQYEDAQFAAERAADPPACPEHGWPIEPGPNGERHCRFGGHFLE